MRSVKFTDTKGHNFPIAVQDGLKTVATCPAWLTDTSIGALAYFYYTAAFYYT